MRVRASFAPWPLSASGSRLHVAPSFVGGAEGVESVTPTTNNDLTGKGILVCVCGGISAYKVADVVSKLAQRGAGVTVAMTAAAQKFVTPLTFQALSGRAVLTDLWGSEHPGDVQHIALTAAADLVLVAPATANVIGKIAAGIADDLVTTLVISAASPVLLAPAMNDRMWNNPIVQDNVAKLKRLDYTFVAPAEGWLACRSVGPGRMAEGSDIIVTLLARLGSIARTPDASS